MIEVININLVIEKKTILDNVSLTIKPGTIVGLIGRNGSGKTMLMKCICGFIRPTSGEINIDGKRIGIDVDFPDGLGVIIETPGFIPYYSGFKNLKLLAGLNKKADYTAIKTAISKLGLDPESRKHVGKYSLGMKQRLAIAQAVMENQSLLVLDEPMNGLDKEGVLDVRQILLEEKAKGKAIIISSHSAEDIEVLCDEVYMMEKGRISRE